MRVCVYVCVQIQVDNDDLQRKLTILQGDLEKSEDQVAVLRKEVDEKSSSLDETERLV